MDNFLLRLEFCTEDDGDPDNLGHHVRRFDPYEIPVKHGRGREEKTTSRIPTHLARKLKEDKSMS